MFSSWLAIVIHTRNTFHFDTLANDRIPPYLHWFLSNIQWSSPQSCHCLGFFWSTLANSCLNWSITWKFKDWAKIISYICYNTDWSRALSGYSSYKTKEGNSFSFSFSPLHDTSPPCKPRWLQVISPLAVAVDFSLVSVQPGLFNMI